jgi:hypothetical protein
LKFPNVKIMLVIPETHASRVFTEPAVESEIGSQFISTGYRVLAQPRSYALRKSNRLDALTKNPTGANARALMAKYGADIMIIGQGTSKLATSNQRNIFSCRSHVELKAVLRENGRILVSSSAEGSGADSAEFAAAKIALRAAGAQLVPTLMKAIGAFVGGPTVPVQAAIAPDPESDPRYMPRVAVFPFDYVAEDDSYRQLELSNNLPDMIRASIAKNAKGVCILINRASLEDGAAKQHIQLSGLFDDSAGVSRLGMLLKVDYAVMGRIMKIEQKKSSKDISIRGLGSYEETTATATVMLKVVKLRTGQITT